MRWRKDWDLTTVPDDLLMAEAARRASLRRKVKRGGTKPTCDCGQCRKCRMREWMRAYRAKRQNEQEG